MIAQEPLTSVRLVFYRDRVEHWLRFGRDAGEHPRSYGRDQHHAWLLRRRALVP